MKNIAAAFLITTLSFLATGCAVDDEADAALAAEASARTGDSSTPLACGTDGDRSLLCIYDRSTAPGFVTLEGCDDADTRRPSCAAADFDLSAIDDGAPARFPWDQCTIDDSFPGHIEFGCFGLTLMTCDEVPTVGWVCR